MSDEKYPLVSTKITADISQFMKLCKKKYNAKTESEGLRRFIEEHNSALLTQAQHIAELQGQFNREDENAT